MILKVLLNVSWIVSQMLVYKVKVVAYIFDIVAIIIATPYLCFFCNLESHQLKHKRFPVQHCKQFCYCLNQIFILNSLCFQGDSTRALSWVKNSFKIYELFIDCRVSENRKFSYSSNWLHINSGRREEEDSWGGVFQRNMSYQI